MGRNIKEYMVKDLLIESVDKEDNYFRRLDVIVNYMAIEAYYGKNENGWDIYSKYEISSKRNVPKSKARFEKLIQSVETNGCLFKKWPLKISHKKQNKKFLHVRDGAHRLACAIYFGCESVYGYVENNPGIVDIGSRLFLRRKFTGSEIEILENKKHQIFKEMEIENDR